MNSKEKKRIVPWIVVGVLVVALGISLFFVFKQNNNSFPMNGEMQGNFDGERPDMQMMELSEDEISLVKGFFETSPSESEVETYCQENRNYCIYYCTQINSESDYCEDMTPSGMSEMENRTPPEEFQN